MSLLPAAGVLVGFEPHLWPQLQQYCQPHCEHYIGIAAAMIWVSVAWFGCSLVTYYYHLRRGCIAALLSALWLPFCCMDIAVRCRGKYVAIADDLDDIREVWMEPLSPRSIQRNEDRMERWRSLLGTPIP